MPTAKTGRSKRKSNWLPVVGADAVYTGQHSSVSRYSRRVHVLAQACGEFMVVAAIGRAGEPVRITVKTKNLRPPPPGLFDIPDLAAV